MSWKSLVSGIYLFIWIFKRPVLVSTGTIPSQYWIVKYRQKLWIRTVHHLLTPFDTKLLNSFFPDLNDSSVHFPEWQLFSLPGRASFAYAHSREVLSRNTHNPPLLYRCGLQLLPWLQSTVHVTSLISPTICWLEAQRCRSWAFDRYKLRLSSAASPKDSCNMAGWIHSPGVSIGIPAALSKALWLNINYRILNKD